MRVKISAWSILTMLCAGMLWAENESVLFNAGFASDALGVVAPWRVETLEYEVVRNGGPHGESVLRMPLKDGRAYVVQNDLPLQGGSFCTFGAWVRTRGLEKNAARLVVFSDEWRDCRYVYLPNDTTGTWQKVEWKGRLMPGGPYGFAIQAELHVKNGLIEVAAPYFCGERIVASSAKPGTGMLIFHFDFNSLQHNKASIIEILRHVASEGYNAVLWEIENAVRFDCCPDVASPDAFTKDEFREILAMAKRLGLEPIPLMQTFGHGEYVLSHDRFRSFREVAERYDCYCPSNPGVRIFLKRLLHEYLELFGPDIKRFHLGGDEAWFYQTCKNCRIRNPLELYVEHLTDVGAELRARGIRPGCWHDMVLKFSRESGCELKRFKDYTVWFWDYSYPKSLHPWGRIDEPLREMREVGCETIICGSSQCWKEDPFLVRYAHHRENLVACADLARRERLAGLCVTSWTIHQGLKCLQYPLFDFAARRYLRPGANAESDWREVVTRDFGSVPTDAIDALSDWKIPYGKADGRGWTGYKDGLVPPSDGLFWRFADGENGMRALANEYDTVIDCTETALGRVRMVGDLTPLGKLLVEAGELKLAHHRMVAKGLRAESVGEIPFEATRRHYAREYADESVERAVRILYNYYGGRE